MEPSGPRHVCNGIALPYLGNKHRRKKRRMHNVKESVEEVTEECYRLFNNTDTRSELAVAERRMVE